VNIVNYPATLQNYKATRPCKEDLPQIWGYSRQKAAFLRACQYLVYIMVPYQQK
jgi:hypothetical protein